MVWTFYDTVQAMYKNMKQWCRSLNYSQIPLLSGHLWDHTENACSFTAFNSTDIRSVQDNVATPVTAMMVTVCISTDALSSVFISPDLSDTNSFHQCCRTYLYHSVTSDWYSRDNPIDCSSLIPSYDIIPVSGLKVQQAVTALWRFCVCRQSVQLSRVRNFLSLRNFKLCRLERAISRLRTT